MEANNILSDAAQPTEVTVKRKSSRKRRITIFIVVSLLNGGLLVLLWSQLLTPAQPGNRSNSDPSVGNKPLVGHLAPNFTLAVLSKQPAKAISLADFKGKAIVLNFWASWCGPCRDEASLLQSAWQQNHAKGIVFIGINYQDVQSDGLSFIQKYAITYQNVMDSRGATAIDYGVTAMPETFFIDRHGVIVAWKAGTLTAQILQSNLQKLSRRN